MTKRSATRWVLALTGIGSLSTIRLDLHASVEQLE
jgi:hypothetical protein